MLIEKRHVLFCGLNAFTTERARARRNKKEHVAVKTQRTAYNFQNIKNAQSPPIAYLLTIVLILQK
jgi:hypothetical protein